MRVSESYHMCGERCFAAIASWDRDLPISTVGVQCCEYHGIPQAGDALVHAREVVGVVAPSCVQTTVIDGKV